MTAVTKLRYLNFSKGQKHTLKQVTLDNAPK